MEKSREEILDEHGIKEDNRFQLFNLGELEKLIQIGNNKLVWYCLGRERKEDYVDFCKYAYYINKKPRL